MPENRLPYDPTSRESIVAYAERLVGRSLREALDELPPQIDFSGNKGGFGATTSCTSRTADPSRTSPRQESN
jgi:hypothetical protein